MAQRRSKNRRSSRFVTNYLDDNTAVADSSNPAWYQYSSVRPSTSINLTKRDSTVLNPDSSTNFTQQSDWFENLSRSDSFKQKLGGMDKPSQSKKQIKSKKDDSRREEAVESTTASESDEGGPKKKPRFKLPRRNAAKKGRESNIFMEALDNTKDSFEESVLKTVPQQNTSKSSNDDSITNRKLRPTIFKIGKAKSTKKNERNDFDKDLESDPASEHPSLAQSSASATTSAQQKRQSTSLNNSLSSAQREAYGILKEPFVRLNSVTPNKSVTNSHEASRREENRRSSRSRTVLFPIENQDVSSKSLGINATHSVKETLVEKSIITDSRKNSKDAGTVDPQEVTQTWKSSSRSYISTNIENSLTDTEATDSQEITDTPITSSSTIRKSRLTSRNLSKVTAEPTSSDPLLKEQNPTVAETENSFLDPKDNSVVPETSTPVLTLVQDLENSDQQASLVLNLEPAQASPKYNDQRISIDKGSAKQKSGIVVEEEGTSETPNPPLNQEKSQDEQVGLSNPGDVEEEMNKLMQSPEHSGSVNGLLNDLMDSPGGPAQSTMVLTGKPVHRVTQFSFRNGSESGKSDTVASAKNTGDIAASKPMPVQSVPEKSMPPVQHEPLQPDNNKYVDSDSSWSDDPLIHKSDIDIPQHIAKEKSANKNTIDRFLVSRQGSTSAAGKKKLTSKELLAKLKARSEKLMREEEEESKRRAEKEREAAQQKIIANAKLKRLEVERKMKKRKQDSKPVHSAYLVNGVRYRPPKLPRPQNWVTDRLYRHLWRKLEPKFGLRARVKSEDFITELSVAVKMIKKRKKYDNYKIELNKLIRHMAELGIIETQEDFYRFCREFMPYSFREKVIPMDIPGKGLNIPSDPLTLDRPIIRKRHEQNNSENNNDDDRSES